MKKIAVISSFMIGVFLMSGVVTMALGGVEPSPFQPEINKLGAITQGLESIKKRVVDVVMPPDPIIPNDNGAINKLEAMDHQLYLVTAFLDSIVREVMPPDPVEPLPEDVVPALVSVGGAAQGIVDIDAHPPDPVLPVFYEVKSSAQTIVDNVTYYLGLSDCGACSSYTDPGVCYDAGCIWVMPDDPDLLPYCCNPSP